MSIFLGHWTIIHSLFYHRNGKAVSDWRLEHLSQIDWDSFHFSDDNTWATLIQEKTVLSVLELTFGDLSIWKICRGHGGRCPPHFGFNWKCFLGEKKWLFWVGFTQMYFWLQWHKSQSVWIIYFIFQCFWINVSALSIWKVGQAAWFLAPSKKC